MLNTICKCCLKNKLEEIENNRRVSVLLVVGTIWLSFKWLYSVWLINKGNTKFKWCFKNKSSPYLSWTSNLVDSVIEDGSCLWVTGYGGDWHHKSLSNSPQGFIPCLCLELDSWPKLDSEALDNTYAWRCVPLQFK